ncbi:MAG: hypothetical protein ABIB98_00240 [bacterium]
MVYFVHGSDLIQSRNFVGFIKSKFSNSQITAITINDKFNFKDLKSFVPETSLFSETILTIIELNKLPNKDEIKHLEFLETLQKDTNIVLWVGESINKTQPLAEYTKTRKNFTTKFFNSKESISNFELTDAINTKSPAALLILNKILYKNSEASLVIAILASHFKKLLGLKLNCEFAKSMHPFAKSKMEKANKFFSQESIKNILERIYETDIKIKTGARDTKNEMFSLVCHILNSG